MHLRPTPRRFQVSPWATLVWLVALLPLASVPPTQAETPPAVTAKGNDVTLSIQGMDCSGCWSKARAALLEVPGVTGATLDTRTVEARVTLAKSVPSDSLRAAIARAGFTAFDGPGQGKWKAPKGYPEGSDVGIVSHDGQLIGELDELAVPGKVTVVDLYADWCAPCRMIDAHISKVLAARDDVAVRKINIVKWGTPAAKMYLGPRPAIPLVYVYGKDGAAVATVNGFRPRDLDAAIAKGAGDPLPEKKAASSTTEATGTK